MEKKIRIGLIGCGRVAENHIKAIKKSGNARITAVGGGRHAGELGDRLSVPTLDPEEICRSEGVDAVCILTPPQFHYRYTMEALKAGKHVLVEKPVSFSEEEIQNMDAEAKKRGLVCMPGHSYLYLPELARIKRVLEERALGVPTYLYLAEAYYMAPGFFEKYSGPEMDVLCHQLYLSLAYLGIPEKLTAFKSQVDVSQVATGGPQVTVMLEYEVGTLVQILVSWASEDHSSDPFTFKVKVLGSKGSMHFSRRDYVENTDYGYEQGFYQEMFDQEMKYFLTECIGNVKEPLSTMEDALWVCRLHRMVLQSIEEGKVIKVGG